MLAASLFVLECIAVAPASAQSSNAGGLQCLFGGLPALSGVNAAVGQAQVNGGDLAAEHAETELGVKVKMDWRDGRNDAQTNVQGVEAFAAQGGAAAVMSGTGPLLAVEPLGPRLKIVIFNIGATTPQQREMNEWVFANTVIADTESAQMVGTMVNTLGVKTLAIVYDDDAFGAAFRKQIRDAAEKAGMKIVAEVPVVPGATDMRPQLRPLAETSPIDAVALISSGITPGTVIKQAKEIGAEARFWVGEQFSWNAAGLKAAGQAAEGSIATTLLFNTAASNRAAAFASEYEKRFGQTPDTLAGRVYDAVYAVAQAAKNGGACDGATVRRELSRMTTYEGVTGVHDFSKRISETPLTWGQVKDGRLVPIDPSALK
jgi:branched-chain amino acid transport system substrate-binding protein